MTPQDPNTPVYSIGTAARMLGISVQTLRMYENEGLVLSYKTSGKQRLYSQTDIERLVCIRKAIKEEKISIHGIRHIHALIPCWSIVRCPDKEQRECQAFKSRQGGCWTFKHTNNVCAKRECRLCEVYMLSTNCEHIKEKIVEVSLSRQGDSRFEHVER